LNNGFTSTRISRFMRNPVVILSRNAQHFAVSDLHLAHRHCS